MSHDGEHRVGEARSARVFSLARWLFCAVGLFLAVAAGSALELPAEEFRLDNGMTFVIVRRPGATTVAAGWVVDAGATDEQPGSTGTSHLLEHLLFKGSEVIGSRDPELERQLIEKLDAVHEELEQRSADQNGKRVAKLRERAAELETAARDASWPGQFSLLYSEQGAVDLNANALRDATIFHVTLPADRLELWFWLESDRLMRPVFRELHKEKRVIREERRLRVEATPTGLLAERAEAEFWGTDPYGRPTMGLPEDLSGVTRTDVREFFDRHYQPPDLTGVLVGDLERSRVEALATTYFGRLVAAPETPSEPDSGRASAAVPGSFSELCDCPTQIQVRYPTVPFGHPDSYALDLLAGLLNGRSGRLFRGLVSGSEIAFSASAMHNPLRRAGYFVFRGETRGDAVIRALEEAWDEEVDRLRREPVSGTELQRVKNRLVADAYRELKDPSALLRRLLIYQGLGDWRQVEVWPRRLQEVRPEDLRRVTETYLAPDRSFKAIFENRTARRAAR